MHKITVSIGDIDDAIKQFEEYEKKVQQNIKDFLKKLLEDGVQIAKAKVASLNAVETGDLLNSLDKYIYIDGKLGVIFTGSEYACFVEFGTGVAKNGGVGKSSHPKGEELGMTIGTYGEKKGANPNGWWYFDEKQGRKRWTKGMPSRPFMYETAKELESKVIEIAREVFSK